MITSLHLKDFKLFHNQAFEFKNLNLLTGLNGMGKSTVIQALLFIRESIFDKVHLTNEMSLMGNALFNAGKIEDIRYENAQKPYTIEINLGLDNEINSFTYNAEKAKKRNYIELTKISIPALGVDKIYHPKEGLFEDENFVYLQADRFVPQTPNQNFPIGQGQKNKFGNNGVYAISYFHDNKTLPIAKNLCLNSTETLESQTNAWLSFISPSIKVNTEPVGQEIHLDYSFYDSKRQFDPSNVGFGITYVLPIIISLLSAKAGDLIIIENPESHLHPKGQSKLAELMCLAAQNGVQIFCETHSDHIINGTLVQCKKFEENQKGLDRSKIKVYYFDRTEGDNASKIHDIEILEGGKIIYPPQNFFDQISKDRRILMGF